MLKERSRDPYRGIRRVNPPPDFLFINRKAYDRPKAREEEETIIQEALEDLFEE